MGTSHQWNKPILADHYQINTKFKIKKESTKFSEKKFKAETRGPLILNSISNSRWFLSSIRIQCSWPDSAHLYPAPTPHGKNIFQSKCFLWLPSPYLLCSDHILGLIWIIYFIRAGENNHESRHFTELWQLYKWQYYLIHYQNMSSS